MTHNIHIYYYILTVLSLNNSTKVYFESKVRYLFFLNFLPSTSLSLHSLLNLLYLFLLLKILQGIRCKVSSQGCEKERELESLTASLECN